MTQHHAPVPPPPPPHHSQGGGIPMGLPHGMVGLPQNATPLNVNNLMGNSTCIHARNSIASGPPGGVPNHIDPTSDQVLAGNLIEETSAPYFMNRDGCMETTASAANDMAAGVTGGPLPPAPPPPLLGKAFSTCENV